MTKTPKKAAPELLTWADVEQSERNAQQARAARDKAEGFPVYVPNRSDSDLEEMFERLQAETMPATLETRLEEALALLRERR